MWNKQVTPAIVLLLAVGSIAQDIVVELVKDEFVQMNVGPEDAVYCMMEDPTGTATYEGFGQCLLRRRRITEEHAGAWKMTVGLPNRIMLEEYNVFVILKDKEPKPTVTTRVVTEKPTVDLTCTVSSPYESTACQFRDPSGNVLLAAQGVEEDRFSFSSFSSSLVNGVYTHECALRITDPLTSDLGLWRCSIATAEEIYYGFLTVLCPWAMMDPVVAASVVTEPVLQALRPIVTGLEGESITLSARVPAAIRYCHFRASNGTIITVSEGTETPGYSIAGAGLDSGECAIRFEGVGPGDSGAWRCTVGLQGVAEEQNVEFTVTVQEHIAVHQYMAQHGNALIVEGSVYNSRAVEYCRFVRIDGYGFTSDNVPPGYSAFGNLNAGQCGLSVAAPTMLDHHPWTVVSRLLGHSQEISGVTPHTIAGPVTESEDDFIKRNNGLFIFLMVLLGLCLVGVSFMIGFKKNRTWTQEKFVIIRNSVRKSFTKQDLVNMENDIDSHPKITTMSA